MVSKLNVLYMNINRLGINCNNIDIINPSAQDYYPYGSILRSYVQDSKNNKYKFTGKERDTESNLDYFGARYYDSEIGRWLSVDPLADKYPGWSPYTYCLNSPVNLIDPNGMWSSNPLFGDVHAKITKEALSKYVSNDVMNHLIKYGQLADAGDYQKPTNAYRHAMRKEGESIEDATKNLNAFLSDQFSEFNTANNEDEKWAAFAYVLHAIQDMLCYSHFNKEWNGDLIFNYFLNFHFVADFELGPIFENRYNSSIKVSEYLYKAFISGKPPVIKNYFNVSPEAAKRIAKEGKEAGYMVIIDGVVQ